MKPRSISIVPVLNGFIVTVGCQAVVVTSTKDLGNYITQYYNDPKIVEEVWIRAKVNNMMDGPIDPRALNDCTVGAQNPCPPPTTGCCETESKPARNY